MLDGHTLIVELVNVSTPNHNPERPGAGAQHITAQRSNSRGYCGW